jgi:hypothetical protein
MMKTGVKCPTQRPARILKQNACLMSNLHNCQMREIQLKGHSVQQRVGYLDFDLEDILQQVGMLH